MDGMNAIDSLQFKQNSLRHDEVEAMDVDSFAAIENRTDLLALERNAGHFELDAYGAMVDSFEEARPQLAMHFNAASTRSVNEIFEIGAQRRCDS